MTSDISERKQAEDTLRQSERRFRALLENSYDGIALLNQSGDIQYVSPSTFALLGYTDSELLSKSLLDFVHPDDADMVLHEFQALIRQPAQKHLFHYRIRHKDGSWRWLEVMASNLLGEPAVEAIVGNYRDITERKRIEEAIRESERFARATVNALSAHIAILDENGVILAVNDAWRQFARENGMLGSRMQFEGVNYIAVAEQAQGPDEESGLSVAAGIRQVLSGERLMYMHPYPCHSPDEKRWFVCRVTRFPGDGPARIVIAHENVTEQKLAEQELASLYNATSVLFEAENVDELGKQVVEVIVREFGAVNCGLLLVREDRRQAVSVALAGHLRLTVGDAIHLDGPGLIARALRTGAIVYAPDVSREPDYFSANPDTRSELVVPLMGARGPLGALDLQSTQLAAFIERDRRILSAFGERVAVTLETMQLYEEINRYAEELEGRVARRTAELHHAMEQVEAILSNTSDAIVLANDQNDIERANPAFRRMFGYAPDAVYPASLRAHFAADALDELDRVLREAAETSAPVQVELAGRRADGSIFAADVAIAPVMEVHRAGFSVVLTLRDITERKQAEENLRLSLARERELSELKSRFTSMVSHEFRNPLAVIQSASDLLRHYGDRLDQARQQEQLDEIHRQVRRLTELLDDILTVTRAQTRSQALQAQTLDLAAFLSEIAREMQLTTRLHLIRLSAADDLPPVYLDPKLLRQAVGNLLSNAIKYSPEGGMIRLSTEWADDRVLIRVRDQGIGIPAVDLPRLFEAFHRAHNVGAISGSGLGLAIVQQAAQAHGGEVLVDSVEGAGTEFTLVLPVDVTTVHRQGTE